MKKVLFVGINARYTHTALSIRCLCNAAQQVNKVDTHQIIEFQINDPVLHIVNSIVLQKPDIILFSVYIWNRNIIEQLLPDVHALLTEAKIILGGPEVYGAEIELRSKFPFVAACVSGYGETVIKTWAGAQWKSIEYNSELFPEWDPADFINAGSVYTVEEKDMLANRYLYYESSRGCPFNCAYCLSSNSKQHFVEKPISIVKKDIEDLMKFNPMLIKFVDRSFNAHQDRAHNIWEYLAKTYYDKNVRFHFEIMPSLLTEEDVAFLESLPQHLFQFEAGIQTIHSSTRKLIHRAGVWEKEQTMLKLLLKKNSIPLHIDMIVGLPGETNSDIAATFDALMDLGADHVQVGFLKVLPGTEIFEKKEQYGIVAMHSAPYEIYKTSSLSLQEKVRWKQVTLLVESIANNAIAPDIMQQARLHYGSWTGVYDTLLDYMLQENFDIRTKNRERLIPLITSWWNFR